MTDDDRAAELSELVDRTMLLSDGVALAWAVIALGDRWQVLSVAVA
jgi:hypothetical protein